jgi:hypothetical protein
MPRSGVKNAGVELIGDTDLGRVGVGGWSTATMGDTSSDRGMRHERGRRG